MFQKICDITVLCDIILWFIWNIRYSQQLDSINKVMCVCVVTDDCLPLMSHQTVFYVTFQSLLVDNCLLIV